MNRNSRFRKNNIISKYENIILLSVFIICMILMIMKRYIYIECFTICLIVVIMLIRKKIAFVDFYLKQIIISILSVIIVLGLTTSFLYYTHNFIYIAKGYIECVLLKTNDYSLLSVSAADNNDGKYSIRKSTHMVNRNNNRDFYEQYMMKKNVTLDEDFKIIEKIVGKIKEYKPFSNNVYYLKLEQGGIFVVINRYEKFTIFKFLVNS